VSQALGASIGSANIQGNMTREEILHYLRKMEIIAGRLEATTPNQSRWIGVYPIQDTDRYKNVIQRIVQNVHPIVKSPIFRIRLFEIRDNMLDKWFGEDALLNKVDAIAMGEEDLFATLDEFKISLDVLTVPWRCNYPL
jgi:hypothetical protein